MLDQPNKEAPIVVNASLALVQCKERQKKNAK